MKRSDTRRLVLSALAGCVVVACGSGAYAQARARRGSDALVGFGRVGETSVQQGLFLRTERSTFGPPQPRFGGGYAGGYAARGYARAGGQNLGRPQATPLAGYGAARVGGVFGAMASPMNFGLAREFGRIGRDYTGRNTWARARHARFGMGRVQPRPYMALQQPQRLLYENAGLAPVRRATAGGRIYDDLTLRTLRNIPHDTKARLDPTVPRRSFADMMEARLNAEYRKKLEDGWSCFSEGRYREGTACFQVVVNQREHASQALLGWFFCEVAVGRITSAIVLTDRMVVSPSEAAMDLLGSSADGSNPFLVSLGGREDLHALRRDHLVLPNPRERFAALKAGETIDLSAPDAASCSCQWRVDGGGAFDAVEGSITRYTPSADDSLITLVVTCDGAPTEYRQSVVVRDPNKEKDASTPAALVNRPWSQMNLDTALAIFQGLSQRNKDNPRFAAAYAILLWYSGDRAGATQVAERIREAHGATKFARLPTMMREAVPDESALESVSLR